MKKLSEVRKLQREFNESYFREEPTREEPPKSEQARQLEEFAHNKSKRTEIINAWTKIKDHPEAKDMSSEVGSAFDESDLDEDLRAAYEVLDDGGFIYCSFENTVWIKHKGQLIRVL